MRTRCSPELQVWIVGWPGEGLQRWTPVASTKVKSVMGHPSTQISAREPTGRTTSRTACGGTSSLGSGATETTAPRSSVGAPPLAQTTPRITAAATHRPSPMPLSRYGIPFTVVRLRDSPPTAGWGKVPPASPGFLPRLCWGSTRAERGGPGIVPQPQVGGRYRRRVPDFSPGFAGGVPERSEGEGVGPPDENPHPGRDGNAPRRQFRCSASLRPPQEPSLGRASTAPVVELRRNSIPEIPDISRAFAVFPSGNVTTVPAVT